MMTYDVNGYLASQTDWNGNLTTYVNDAHGQPLSITEAAGTAAQRVTTIGYLANFHLPAQIAAPGLTTNFAYDAVGNLLARSQTDTTGSGSQTRKWSYGWVNFLPVSTTDPRGNKTQFSWDASGALVSITNALGQVTKITKHLAGGLPQTIVDPNGVTTTLAYNARNRLVSRTVATAAGPLTTTNTYDAVGDLIGLTLPDNASLAMTYDAARRPTNVADVFGQHIDYILDALGDRTRSNTVAGSATTRTRSANFDALGRMLQDIGGAGQTTTYGYDSNGNRISATDPLGRVTTTVFDALNRPVQVTDPAGGVTAIAYDAHDHPVKVTDPNGNATTYAYDGFGKLLKQISPDSGTTMFSYDLAGNVVKRVDAAGAVTVYAYDALNRLISRNYSAAPGENVTLTYDQASGGFGIGRLTTMTDPAGILKRVYDERGNIVKETRTTASGGTAVTAYAYDAAGRLAALTYPSGWTAKYTRDGMGRITAVAAAPPGGGNPLSVAANIAYQPFGPVDGLTYGNGIAETRAFDLDYRLTGLSAAGANPLQRLSYGYDKADNVLSIADAVTPDNNQTFSYDALDRLTGASGFYGTQSLSWDPVGNALTVVTTAGNTSSTTGFAYAAGSNRLVAMTVNGNPMRQFAHTATGNIAADLPPKTAQLSATANYLSYNQDNRLVIAVTRAGTSLASPTTNYAYDGFGQRLLKTLSASRTTTYYQYDFAGRLLEESAAANGGLTPRLDYIYLGDRPIAQLTPGSGSLFFVHSDRLGTPQLMTGASQGVLWQALYRPFGSTKLLVNTVAQNFRFPGQYADAETGYYHNGFRDYAPSIGRYLESDPIGLGDGLNTYAYVGGNPVNSRDPAGLISASRLGETIFDAITGGSDFLSLFTYASLTQLGGDLWFAYRNGISIFTAEESLGLAVSALEAGFWRALVPAAGYYIGEHVVYPGMKALVGAYHPCGYENWIEGWDAVLLNQDIDVAEGLVNLRSHLPFWISRYLP